MPDPPQIPSPSAIVTPAIDALVSARPRALKYLNAGQGRYTSVVRAWRAQAARLLLRDAAEARASRLSLAEGEALRELAASEFETSLDFTPQTAVGHVTMVRASGPMAQGTIREGERFFVEANPNARPVPIAAAEYAARAPVYVAASQTTITIPLIAARPGTQANIVQRQGVPSTLIQAASIFDTNFATTSCAAAGGTDSTSDDDLRRAARANAQGQFGPTETAIVAEVLVAGVRHYAYFDYWDHNLIGKYAVAVTYVADPSWASSSEWAAQISQAVNDNVLGFGARHAAIALNNRYIKVDATVRLQRTQDLSDTSDVEAAIRKAVRSYFDDRRDFYLWKLSALRAVITSAHPKILVCTAASVSDYFDGSTLNEPALSEGGILHFYAADNAITPAFLPPI
jgi:hypothetical protein